MLTDLSAASVYVEFCDRGSLDDLINAYQKDSSKALVPERFIWHAFLTLCDGLAYLQGGRSYINTEDYRPVPTWTPILHRDLKPDNILLRSRDTLGSKKYFYCVISDFGLACEDWPDGHPKEDYNQNSRYKLGTPTFHAPELLWTPYPIAQAVDPSERDRNKQMRQKTEQSDLFPRFIPNPHAASRYVPVRNDCRFKHSQKTDLWALGVCIYNLAQIDAKDVNGNTALSSCCHIQYEQKPPGMDINTFRGGTVSIRDPMRLSTYYTEELDHVVGKATKFDHKRRPNAMTMVGILKSEMSKTIYTTHDIEESNDRLPGWATRVHEYHSK